MRLTWDFRDFLGATECDIQFNYDKDEEILYGQFPLEGVEIVDLPEDELGELYIQLTRVIDGGVETWWYQQDVEYGEELEITTHDLVSRSLGA